MADRSRSTGFTLPARGCGCLLQGYGRALARTNCFVAWQVYSLIYANMTDSTYNFFLTVFKSPKQQADIHE